MCARVCICVCGCVCIRVYVCENERDSDKESAKGREITKKKKNEGRIQEDIFNALCDTI